MDSAPELQRVVPVRGGGVVVFGLGFLPRSYAFAIKFDRTGQLDRGFGDRGRLALGAAGGTEEIHDLAAWPDGSLLALGSRGERSRRVFVAGYTAGGEPDRDFGRNGRADAGLLRAPRGLDVRSRNRATRGGAISAGPGGTTAGVAFLSRLDGSAERSIVFRLDRGGALDRRFGRRGVTRVDPLG